MSVHRCSRDDCELPGPWRPVLQYWPPEGWICHEPITIEIGVYLCLRHRDEFKIEDVVSDHLNLIAVTAAKHRQVVEPDLTRTKLVFIPVDEGRLEEFRDGASS